MKRGDKSQIWTVEDLPTDTDDMEQLIRSVQATVGTEWTPRCDADLLNQLNAKAGDQQCEP